MLFLATALHETGGGNLGSYKDYRALKEVGGSGAGYLQITGKNTNHRAFLDYIGDSFVGDTQDYIAKNYAWESAGWVWSICKHNNTVPNLNDYV
jgi:predicted chitinase